MTISALHTCFHDDAAIAIQKPLREVGVSIEDDALRAMYAASKGYPFFLQELGYQVWQAAEKSPITHEDVIENLSTVFTSLDRNFFDVRFDRISPSERLFLRAMSELENSEGISITSVAHALGKTPSAISMVRRSLMRKGMIYSPQHGAVDYTVPMFAEYMRRIMPGQ